MEKGKEIEEECCTLLEKIGLAYLKWERDTDKDAEFLLSCLTEPTENNQEYEWQISRKK